MTINSHSIKEQNIVSVYRSIEKSDGETRNEISAQTGLSVVTVCKMIDLLFKNNLLIEEKSMSSTVGRKACNLRINFTVKRILILDLTKKRFSAKLLYLNYENVAAAFQYSYQEERTFEENLSDFMQQVREEMAAEPETGQPIIGVGVIAPGPYLKKEDRVINKRLKELSEIKLKKFIEGYYPNQYILIEEDVKFAGLYSAEFDDKLKDRTVFYAYIDEGVGGTIIKNGEIEFGSYSFAGDFGQLLLSGKTVEEEIAFPNFFESLGISDWKKRNVETVFSDIDLNSPETQEKIRELEKKTAMALYNVSWIVDPYYIVIESRYLSEIPGFTEHVTEDLKRLYGGIRGDLRPKISVSGDSVQYAYKGAAYMILNYYLADLS